MKFLTLYECDKKYHTQLGNEFELVAITDTDTKIENIQFVGDITTHSTEFDFDVEKIKSILFAYQKMTPAQADAFDTFEEGGKIEKQPNYKDITDMSRENDGR